MWAKRILWAIYISLLGVLLPHTAWAFQQFEPPNWDFVGWVAAFAFEAAIAAFTWRLKEKIEATPRYTAGKVWLRKLAYRYVNPYAVGLLAALLISSVANWAHAVEFGRSFAVFTRYSVPTWLFSVGFGGILPVISFLFARVLAEAEDTEGGTNPESEKAKETIIALRQELRQANTERRGAEDSFQRQLEESEKGRMLAEERFGAVGDLVRQLFAEEKRQRILAIKTMWPQLPGKVIADMTDASQSYVSEVLTVEEQREENAEVDD